MQISKPIRHNCANCFLNLIPAEGLFGITLLFIELLIELLFEF